MNKPISGTLGGGGGGYCGRLIQIGIEMWALDDHYALVISITERSKRKVSDKCFEIFITAQDNFVGKAGPEMNILYVCMANGFLLTGLWEWKIIGKVRKNHNLSGNCPSNKN
jgi:hypothetical protein